VIYKDDPVWLEKYLRDALRHGHGEAVLEALVWSLELETARVACKACEGTGKIQYRTFHEPCTYCPDHSGQVDKKVVIGRDSMDLIHKGILFMREKMVETWRNIHLGMESARTRAHVERCMEGLNQASKFAAALTQVLPRVEGMDDGDAHRGGDRYYEPCCDNPNWTNNYHPRCLSCDRSHLKIKDTHILKVYLDILPIALHNNGTGYTWKEWLGNEDSWYYNKQTNRLYSATSKTFHKPQGRAPFDTSQASFVLTPHGNLIGAVGCPVLHPVYHSTLNTTAA